LLLMDLKLPYVMGLDVLRWIRTQPATPLIIVMLTASAEEADITEAYRLGANAFLTKPSEANKLEDMVQAIKGFWLTHNTPAPEPLDQSREGTFTPLARSLFHVDGLNDDPGNGDGHPDRHPAGSGLYQVPAQDTPARSTSMPSLSKRQIEVMRLIAEGYSTRKIADRLSLSIKTIEKHRQALMARLDIHEVATLTRYAVSRGLVECNVGTRNGWPVDAPKDAVGHGSGSGFGKVS
jgi:DNA-binding NarL/FixJ family response regulator